MAENSAIEWTTHTFNPWLGCTKVAAGCQNCYAEALMDKRYGKVQWGPEGTRVLTSPANWRKPLAWNRAATCCCQKGPLDHQHEAGCPQRDRPRVFCASLADVFENWQGEIRDSKGKMLWGQGDLAPTESPITMIDVRRRLFALIDATPHLDWLLLTKRPENILEMLERTLILEQGGNPIDKHFFETHGDQFPKTELADKINEAIAGNYRFPNLWLGTSIATQADADRNIPELLKCRDLATVLFVSAEPLVEAVDIAYPPSLFPNGPRTCCNGFDCGCQGLPVDPWPWLYPPEDRIDWLIIGGESGPHARPCNVAWIRSLKDQCQAAGVPAFIKQLGAKSYQCLGGRDSPAAMYGRPVDCRGNAGYGCKPLPLKDPKGGDWNEWPADLRVRQFPKVEAANA